MQHHETLTYRPEIDGLRAIAVSAVVLYHFGFPGIGGGFVGVDVFFVISGFLIGGLLWNELFRTGDVALGRFFMRRIRRLAPAFFAMAAVTTAVACLILLPFEFRAFGKSLVSATAWLSNVQFFREAGYFDTASESKVLLHTWSLAVEEQFYLALPLLLLVLRRRSKRFVVSVLATVWALSLAGNIAMMAHAPTASFFLFPFRAWEMLSGVLLAIWQQESRREWQGRAVLSWLGLGLVLAATALAQPGPHFPGWQAVVPVAGTVLLLLNGRDDNRVNRLLSARVPVFVGLISYSLYLWHWPVFTLSSYWRGEAMGPVETGFWLLVAVLLSVAAWAWIERPARKALADSTLLKGFAVMAVASVSVGAWAWLSNGAPDRFGPPARTHIDASTSFFTDWSRCSVRAEGPLKGIETCAVGPDGEPQVLFWGDSHLRALMGGVNRAALEVQTPGLVIWHAGCPPLFGLGKTESAATVAQDERCLAANQQILDGLGAFSSARQIVLVGRWTYYASGSGFGVDEHNKIVLSAAPGFGLAAQGQQALYEAAWDLTVQRLKPHFEQIHVLRQAPEMPRYDSRSVATKLAHGRATEETVAATLSVDASELTGRFEQADRPLNRLSSEGAIRLIDPWPMLCTPQCSVVHDGVSYYFDNNHLNTSGADALRGLWRPVLSPAGKP